METVLPWSPLFFSRNLQFIWSNNPAHYSITVTITVKVPIFCYFPYTIYMYALYRAFDHTQLSTNIQRYVYKRRTMLCMSYSTYSLYVLPSVRPFFVFFGTVLVSVNII